MVHRELEKNTIKKARTIHHILAFLGVYKKIRVIGHSMWPLLHDGDIIYTKDLERYSVGDIIVAEHPFRKIKIIKRIESIDEKGYVLKSLDSVEREDSSSFGSLKKTSILGKVIAIKLFS